MRIINDQPPIINYQLSTQLKKIMCEYTAKDYKKDNPVGVGLW